MPKVLTAKQIREWDSYTIQNEPIASIDLMERACRAFVEWFVSRYDATNQIGIVCGTGNNGGDGLGIARMLHQWNYHVKVWIVRGSVPETNDFKANWSRIPAGLNCFEIATTADRGLFVDCDVLIDAIFGSGLSRAPEGIYAQAIQCFNNAESEKIAVDIPSGWMADAPSTGDIVQVHHTVTFQLPKLSFFFHESATYVGQWHVVDIGLNKKFLKQCETLYFYSSSKSVRGRLQPRGEFSHKGDYGRALIVSGSLGKMGACVLASRAAMRSGLGLLTVHVPKCGYDIIQTSVPEAMASIDNATEVISDVRSLDSYNVIGVGPGIGQAKETVQALRQVLESGKPLVIDADALNIISSHSELLHLIPAGSILTPHPKEFERLVGSWKNSFERLDKQTKLAVQLKSVVLVKGAYTAIATPVGEIHFNTTGNPGMATGGSGDVLTGILTGLLAQGYTPEDATVLGVYLHGLAGDEAAHQKGGYSLIASDLIDYLPAAFRKLT